MLGARNKRRNRGTFRDILIGTVAGAAGTIAVNIATYLDKALRGRPSSEVPAEVAQKIAAGVGANLSHENASGDKT